MSSSTSDDGEGSSTGSQADDAVEQEIAAIRRSRMTAGQIKRELDSLGVSYAALLEKSEFVKALAEARAQSPLPPRPSDKADAGVETAAQPPSDTTAAAQGSPTLSAAPEAAGADPSVAEAPTAAGPSVPSEGEIPPKSQAAASEPRDSATSMPQPSATADGVPDGMNETPAADFNADGSGIAADPPTPSRTDEQTPTSQDSHPVGGETVAGVNVDERSSSDDVAGTKADAGQASSSGGASTVQEEVSKIREARMTARQIKAELDGMGVGHGDLFEKADFVQRLAEARLKPNSFAAGAGGASVAAGDPSSAAEEASSVSSSGGVAGSSPRGGESRTASDTAEPTADSQAERGGPDRREVEQMRVSQIKMELHKRGVSYAGLLEKSEFVDALLDARARGATSDAGSGGGSNAGSSDGGSAATSEAYDPTYKDVEMKRMKRDDDQQQQQKRRGAGPGPGGQGGFGAGGPGDMGGFDLGSLLGGLGGMGGAGPGGAGGGAGGFDIGSILGGLGGMGGAGGPAGAGAGGPGGVGGGMGGMGGNIGDMLGKVMNNPKAMAALQKAQQNPKVMAAVQDVAKNGLGAMAKYQGDPEIAAVIEELRGIF